MPMDAMLLPCPHCKSTLSLTPSRMHNPKSPRYKATCYTCGYDIVLWLKEGGLLSTALSENKEREVVNVNA